MSSDDNVLDAIIVGAGPAGISAAVYLKRAGINFKIFERKRTGGLLHNAHLVENYPGFDGLPGKRLVEEMEGQLAKWDILVELAEVTSIASSDPGFRISLLDPEPKEMEARTVIIATGTRPIKLDLDGSDIIEGKHLFYEITDMPDNISRKEVVIIGGGDAAFDYALNISKRGASARIAMRSDRTRCLPLLYERAENDPHIQIYPDCSPASFEIQGDRLVLGCPHMQIKADIMLVAIGRRPSDELIVPLQRDTGANTLPGLYMAGDVQQGSYRQMGIAVGDGIKSAMGVIEFLEEIQ